MADAALGDRVFTEDEFLKWNCEQERRYELVNWRAVEMMTGARRPHRLCVSNVFGVLQGPARSKGCEPTSHDAAIRIENGRICYPDIVVECGEADDEQTIDAVDPRLIVEVLSAGTRYRDQTSKLVSYKAIASLQCVIIIDPQVVFVDVHMRSSKKAWSNEIHSDLNAAVELPIFGTSLPLVDVYRGLDPKPYLSIVDD